MSATDDKLAEWILDVLCNDARVSQHRIDVSVSGGVVTLRGTVQSHRRKLAAGEIASSFEGCCGVVNEIHVRPPEPVSDTEIAGHVRAMLDAHADITKAAITVTVRDGEVTLAGHVGSQAERALTVDLVMSVRGVRTLSDEMVVDLQLQIGDQALSRQIELELTRTRGLRGANLKVAVNGDAAVLSGRVAELWQKETAGVVALRFPLRVVRNDLVVIGTDSPKVSES